MNNSPHLTISNTWDGHYRMHCAICGLTLDLVPPVPINTALRAIRQFKKEHQHVRSKPPAGSRT